MILGSEYVLSFIEITCITRFILNSMVKEHSWDRAWSDRFLDLPLACADRHVQLSTLIGPAKDAL